MRGLRTFPAFLSLAVIVSACDANFLSFSGAETAEDCRTAHENARMNNNITGGGSLGRSLIDDTLERCLSRVASGAPIDTTASIGMSDQALPQQSVPVAAPAPTPAPRREPTQTFGFCPPNASVLYGGTSYCVRP